MDARFLKRLAAGPTPLLLLLIALLVSLQWMSGTTQNSATSASDASFYKVLVFNAMGLVGLLTLIGINIYSLVQQYRAGAAGSRLTLRMVLVFVVLAVAPVSIVYYFSLQFLHRGIDSWFDVQIDAAMEDALELSRASLDLQMRERLKQTETILSNLSKVPPSLTAIALSDLRTEHDALELTLLGRNAQIIASSSATPLVLVPDRPGEDILLQLRQGNNYVGLDPIRDEGLHIRAVVADPTEPSLVLQGLFPLPEHMSSLAVTVQEAYSRYKELAYLREALKQSFSLALSLVLLFSLLVAIWAAFFSARRMTAPIRDLVEGTRAVAGGDYNKRIPLTAQSNELGFLISSFNDMTRRIAQARDTVARSQRQEQQQRAYLETVLGSLSTGVLTFDGHMRLRTANRAAAQILGAELDKHLGSSLDEITEYYPSLQRFAESLAPHLQPYAGEWKEAVILIGTSGRQVLMCRSTPLAFDNNYQAGHVVVFDDITALIQAQRDAAWGEVARRMAHEIKNPLTPIQLSAERLRHKYLKKMDERDAKVLDRSTHTIIQQVETMKEMVNAFSEYARPPQMRPEPIDFNKVVQEVLDLYPAQSKGTQIEFAPHSEPLPIEGDAGRLRQVIHNLAQNALEALEQQASATLTIHTRAGRDETWHFAELTVSDNGPGFPRDVLDKVFEPYMTTKPKGTGLGLAIVKKIVEEHGGMIWAENQKQGGGRVVIRLPIIPSKFAEYSEMPPARSSNDARNQS